MYPNLIYRGLKKIMFKKCSIFLCTLGGFNFIKTVYELFDNPSYLYKSSFTMNNITEGYDVSIFPNCVKKM